MFVYLNKNASDGDIQRTGRAITSSIKSNMEDEVYLAAHPDIVKVHFVSGELRNPSEDEVHIRERRYFPYTILSVVLVFVGGVVTMFMRNRKADDDGSDDEHGADTDDAVADDAVADDAVTSDADTNDAVTDDAACSADLSKA